jgi:DNA-binding NarL/FixJ family response regulator
VLQKSYSILLIDNHEKVRSLLARRLNALPEFHVVGETASALRGAELASALSPDIILFDSAAPGSYGAAVCAQIQRSSPGSRVVVYSSYLTEGDTDRYKDAGASRCLLKGMTLQDLAGELHAVMRNGTGPK